MAFWNQSQADFSNLGMAPTPEQMGDAPEPAGFLESAGEMVQSGLVTSGTGFWMAVGGTTSVGADWVKSQVTGVDTTEQQDIFFGQVIDPAVRYLEGMNHKERTMAGGLTYGIGKVLTEFAGGGAPAMAVAEFSGRATGEVLGGKSAGDANMLALNQAAFAYAGAALPGALGGTIAMKAASGAGINVVAGVGQRATEAAILRHQGDIRAEDISVFGLQDMVIDAVLGAAFGTLEPTRGGKPMPKPDGKAIDGAMTIDRARFEDAQVSVRAPEVLNKVDRGIKEQVRALQENRAPVLEPLPDAVTMPARDGLFAKVGSEAYIENLRAWMGDSKVVDEQGNPMVVYRGVPRDFGEGLVGREDIFFTDNPEKASEYATAGNPTGGNVIPAHLRIVNPLTVDAGGKHYTEVMRQSINRAKADGHDGVIVKNVADNVRTDDMTPSTVYVAFNGEQVKSAIGNSGRFDIEGGSLTDLVDATELDAKLKNMPADEIAAALGIKPDPEFKAFQQEIAESRNFVDLELPMIEDVDPSTVAEVRKAAQEIEATGRVIDDAEVVAADDYVSRVKSIGDIMGCMLRLGA